MVLWPFSYMCCFFVVFCTSVGVTAALVFPFHFLNPLLMFCKSPGKLFLLVLMFPGQFGRDAAGAKSWQQSGCELAGVDTRFSPCALSRVQRQWHYSADLEKHNE